MSAHSDHFFSSLLTFVNINISDAIFVFKVGWLEFMNASFQNNGIPKLKSFLIGFVVLFTDHLRLCPSAYQSIYLG